MRTTNQRDSRTEAQLRQHYEVERELALRLSNADGIERKKLYPIVYNEIYHRVPLHPMLTQKKSPEATAQFVAEQLPLVNRFLTPETTFLEIGAGDCALSFTVAKFVKRVYVIEVSDEISRAEQTPANFELKISDGTSIPVAPAAVNVAYSNQLMEHLHPDDAEQQLRNIYASLVEGGVYLCLTPNRLNGPHDISMFFSDTAEGFHLREYTNRELAALFRRVGFRKIQTFVGGRGRFYRVPAFLIFAYEAFLEVLPNRLRRWIVNTFPGRLALGIRIAGIK